MLFKKKFFPIKYKKINQIANSKAIKKEKMKILITINIKQFFRMCNKIKMVVHNMKIKKMKMVYYVYFKAEF